MNRSTFRTIKYMNMSVFSKARYMCGVGFEILARTPVSHLPISYPLLPSPGGARQDLANKVQSNQIKFITFRLYINITT